MGERSRPGLERLLACIWEGRQPVRRGLAGENSPLQATERHSRRVRATWTRWWRVRDSPAGGGRGEEGATWRAGERRRPRGRPCGRQPSGAVPRTPACLEPAQRAAPSAAWSTSCAALEPWAPQRASPPPSPLACTPVCHVSALPTSSALPPPARRDRPCESVS